MGQVIFIAFFALAAVCLAVLGYITGRIDAIEEMEEEYEITKNKENRADSLTDRIRRASRKHKRINYDLRRIWYGAGGEGDKWDIDIPYSGGTAKASTLGKN